jgi:hypothetical protein
MTQTQTLAEVFGNLDRMRADDAAKAVAARDLAAELAILTRYDGLRDLERHDYGGGQRRRELMRLERDLDANLVSLAYSAAGVTLPESMLARAGAPFTPAELRAAFERVGRPRIARIEREDYRRRTRATERTVRAWARTVRWLEGLEAGA